MNKSKDGFTLIELMIVVAIIGILSAVAIPKFAGLLRKSREGTTQGNLGALRSAISVYYGEMEGWFPTADLSGCLTIENGKYISSMPRCATPDYHPNLNTVGTTLNDDSDWNYVVDRSSGSWGHICVDCGHTDSKGIVWSTY